MVVRRGCCRGKRLAAMIEPEVSERHYKARELAKAWGLSDDMIRILFRGEPGVLKIGCTSRPDGKRGYRSLRIPASVAARVHERLSR